MELGQFIIERDTLPTSMVLFSATTIEILVISLSAETEVFAKALVFASVKYLQTPRAPLCSRRLADRPCPRHTLSALKDPLSHSRTGAI